MTPSPAPQLFGNPRQQQLGANHGQTAKLLDALAKLDVSTPASQIGRDRYGSFLTSCFDDHGFSGFIAGRQDIMGNPPVQQQFRNDRRIFD